MNSTTHIAGSWVTICGRKLQRCAVCGEKLVDSLGQAGPLNPDGTPPETPHWEPGRMVRVTPGNPTQWALLDDTLMLPEDSCIDLVE